MRSYFTAALLAFSSTLTMTVAQAQNSTGHSPCDNSNSQTAGMLLVSNALCSSAGAPVHSQAAAFPIAPRVPARTTGNGTYSFAYVIPVPASPTSDPVANGKALLAAVAAANAKFGGSLDSPVVFKLNPGTYTVGTLDLPGWYSIQGAGKDTTTLNAAVKLSGADDREASTGGSAAAPGSTTPVPSCKCHQGISDLTVVGSLAVSLYSEFTMDHVTMGSLPDGGHSTLSITARQYNGKFIVSDSVADAVTVAIKGLPGNEDPITANGYYIASEVVGTLSIPSRVAPYINAACTGTSYSSTCQ